MAEAVPADHWAVTRRNQETDITRTLQTSDRGLFVATLLPLGRYEITVRAAGYRTVASGDLLLRVGQTLNESARGFCNPLSDSLSSQLTNTTPDQFRFQLAREDRPRDDNVPASAGGRDFPDIAMDFGNAFRIGRPFFIPVQYHDACVAALNFASGRNNNGSIGQTIFRNSSLTGVLGAPPRVQRWKY